MVTMSGRAPTWTAPSHSSVVASRKAIHPASVFTGASTATATRPSGRMATELAVTPWGSPSTSAAESDSTSVGSVGSEASSTSTVPASALTTKSWSVAAWKRTISAAEASKTPVR